MKKSIKLTLTVIISIILYILYYLLISKVSPENYPTMLSAFYYSLIFAIIAIPVGIGITWLLQKRKMNKTKTNIILYVIAFLWGFLFGWLSLIGMVIGMFIKEKV